MSIKSVIVFLEGEEPFELEVTKINFMCINDFLFQKSKIYKSFQFDGSERPWDYSDEFMENKYFKGYLFKRIKKGHQGLKWFDCRIKVILEKYGK